MKQVVQDYQTGRLALMDVPAPGARRGGALVQTAWSLVSAGTERQTIALARKSLIAKAIARPDLVGQVLQKARLEGVGEAYRQARARLDRGVPLGYSSSGIVVELASPLPGVSVGDAVACSGLGFASHAEFAFVPSNMLARLPDGVGLDEGAFAGVGAIALHAVRCAEVGLGSRVVVIGLGLLGLIAVQLLRAAGAHVFGVDVVPEKVTLAKQLGADAGALGTDGVADAVRAFTQGDGADAVLITAGSASSAPLALAADLARERARIVAAGLIRLDAPRAVFYEKELELIVPRSSGPGVYDRRYESKGIDYPLSYARWTHGRNLQEFVTLLKDHRVDVLPLITHRFPIDAAAQAYDTLVRDRSVIGLLFEYPRRPLSRTPVVLRPSPSRPAAGTVTLGMVGAGLFAAGTLLPILRALPNVRLRGLATASGLSGARQGERFGFEYCTTEVERVLDDPAVDAVVVATRHDLHARLVIEAFRRKKAVFVEKPLALSRDELDAVIEAARANPAPLMVGFNRRFSLLAQEARRRLSARPGKTVLSCRVNVGPLPSGSWLLDEEEGGGVVLGEMGHFVDLVQYLCGAMVASVAARAIGEPESGQDIAAVLTLADGSVASLVYTVQGDKALGRERVEAFRSGMACVIDNFRRLEVVEGGRTRVMRRLGVDRGHRAELEAFFAALRRGSPMPVAFEEYVSTTLATFAIVESMATGAPCPVHRSPAGARDQGTG